MCVSVHVICCCLGSEPMVCFTADDVILVGCRGKKKKKEEQIK